MHATELTRASGLIREDDTLLVERLVRGDSAAFDEIVARYEGRVTRLAHRLLGWSGEVDDVVQDVFLTVFQKSRSFRGDAALWTWLTIITVNRCRTLRRRLLVRWRSRVTSATATAHSPAADESSLAAEAALRVRGAVAALPTRDREVIVLHHLEHRSIAELVKLLGISRNAVEVRLHRARQKLKPVLADLAPG